jgi:transposase
MFDEETWMELRALHHQGWSISALAEEFNLNRRTVRRYVDAGDPPAYRKRTCPADLTEAQAAYVVRRLQTCNKLRATTLYREIKELGYSASYVSFARRVRLVRSTGDETDPEIRFETDPGVQVQMDWTTLGRWPLSTELVELKALVAILGFSRMVAVTIATDQTRKTTLSLVPRVLADLGGAPQEILTDRDSVFVVGETSDKRAIYAPEWVDLTVTLGASPRACRAYRAKTKGKVERIIREVKEDMVPWLTGQPLPPRPCIADYETLARRWAIEVVAARRHRTTSRIVSEAWAEEQKLLSPIPEHLLSRAAGAVTVISNVVDIARIREQGATVEQRSLDVYERVIT